MKPFNQAEQEIVILLETMYRERAQVDDADEFLDGLTTFDIEKIWDQFLNTVVDVDGASFPRNKDGEIDYDVINEAWNLLIEEAKFRAGIPA
jgi:hypothetical protein